MFKVTAEIEGLYNAIPVSEVPVTSAGTVNRDNSGESATPASVRTFPCGSNIVKTADVPSGAFELIVAAPVTSPSLPSVCRIRVAPAGRVIVNAL
jgi:hypothetical protein